MKAAQACATHFLQGDSSRHHIIPTFERLFEPSDCLLFVPKYPASGRRLWPKIGMSTKQKAQKRKTRNAAREAFKREQDKKRKVELDQTIERLESVAHPSRDWMQIWDLIQSIHVANFPTDIIGIINSYSQRPEEWIFHKRLATSHDGRGFLVALVLGLIEMLPRTFACDYVLQCGPKTVDTWEDGKMVLNEGQETFQILVNKALLLTLHTNGRLEILTDGEPEYETGDDQEYIGNIVLNNEEDPANCLVWSYLSRARLLLTEREVRHWERRFQRFFTALLIKYKLL